MPAAPRPSASRLSAARGSRSSRRVRQAGHGRRSLPRREPTREPADAGSVRALNTALAWLRGGRHGGPHAVDPRHSHANRAVPQDGAVGVDEDDPAGLDPAVGLDELDTQLDLGALRSPHPDALAEEPREAEDIEQPRPPVPPAAPVP